MPILTIYTAYDMYHEKKLIRRRAKRKLDASQFEQCDAIIARVSPPLLDYGTKTKITFPALDPEPSLSQIKMVLELADVFGIPMTEQDAKATTPKPYRLRLSDLCLCDGPVPYGDFNAIDQETTEIDGWQIALDMAKQAKEKTQTQAEIL